MILHVHLKGHSKLPTDIVELDEVSIETASFQMLPNPERAAHVSRAAEEEFVAAVKVWVMCVRAEITLSY